MSNTLRIITDNYVDTGTITVSTGSGTKENLKLNAKSKVWQATSTTAATILVAFTSAPVHAVVLPFTNLSAAATIKVRGFTVAPTLSGVTVVGGTEAYDLTALTACPYGPIVSSTDTVSGVATYAYGGGTCARIYVPDAYKNTDVVAITLEIVDSLSSNIEVSRLIVGQYWAPTYNTSFGLSRGINDRSSHDRTDSGDLITTRSTQADTLTFDLKYMNETDRQQMIYLLKRQNINKPIFVSVFPEDSESKKERDFQIYGKLSSITPINHPTFGIYSTQITVESI